ncbi:MAG: pyridoxamine 5'-phosphate oxidase family protein [Myxococcota bacterium]
MDPKVLQPVDEAVRAAAKRLLREARHGALALLRVEDQAPSVARVGLSTDLGGGPVFPMSTLSGRVQAMAKDARISMLIGEPGRGDPLAHPRITLHGTAQQMKNEDRARVRARYLAKHPKAKLYIDFGDRVTLLQEGRVFASGSPSKVLQDEVLSAVYGCKIRVNRPPEDDKPFVLPHAACAS